MLDIVIPSAARNLDEYRAGYLTTLSMTFNISYSQ